MKKIFVLLFAVTLVSAACGKSSPVGTNAPASVGGSANNAPVASATPPVNTSTAGQRHFHMGFTFWPPSNNAAEIQNNAAFIKGNEDLNVYQQLEGVPWVEAAQNTIPARVTKDWSNYKGQFNSSRPTYIALTPLNVARNGMALYASNTSGQDALPNPWSSYKLNDPAVEQAFVNYAEQAISYFNPQYLAINIETNEYYKAHPEDWANMVALNKFVYQKIKSKHQSITILPTIAFDSLKYDTNAAAEITAVKQLTQYADAIGLSTYPYQTTTYSLPSNYFDLALQFNKPVAITETGMPSQTFSLFGKTYNYTQDDQFKYYGSLFTFANNNHSPFVVFFTATDYDRLIQSLPKDQQATAAAYEYDGTRDSAGNLKKSYSMWNTFLTYPYSK